MISLATKCNTSFRITSAIASKKESLFGGFLPLKTCTFILLLLSCICANAGEVKNSQSGFLNFNIYPVLSDVDNDSVFSLNIFSTLPKRLHYFSLTNFYNQADEEALRDTTEFYSEHNIRWKLSEQAPIDLTIQYNLRSNDDNDRLRLGIRWRLNDTAGIQPFFKVLHLSYAINFHLLQLDDGDDEITQMEHTVNMRFPYISDRLYLAGFIDHTFGETNTNDTPENPIVAEAQFGIRLIDNFYSVAEYRLNQYRRSDINNMAYGLEYKIKW